MCGWPSTRLTIGTPLRNSCSSVRASPSPRPERAWKERKSRSAEVTQTTSTARPASSVSVSAAASASGTSAPITAITTSGRVVRPQPVAAGERLLAGAGVVRLVDRARGEPEVGAGAAGLAELGERVQEAPLEVLAEGGLVGDAAGLLDADRRRDHRLVRAALGAERDAGRRADEDRLAARVDPERPRLQRARDERVVDRPDRQQRLAVARPGRAQLAEHADEVDLGDAELDVAPVVGLAPAHERVGVVGEPVDALAGVPDPRLVDPAAEVGARAHVGRDRHDALGHLRRLARRGRRRSARRPAGSRRCRCACGRGRAGPSARGRRAWRRA